MSKLTSRLALPTILLACGFIPKAHAGITSARASGDVTVTPTPDAASFIFGGGASPGTPFFNGVTGPGAGTLTFSYSPPNDFQDDDRLVLDVTNNNAVTLNSIKFTLGDNASIVDFNGNPTSAAFVFFGSYTSSSATFNPPVPSLTPTDQTNGLGTASGFTANDLGLATGASAAFYIPIYLGDISPAGSAFTLTETPMFGFNSVPEPSSFLMGVIGLIGILVLAKGGRRLKYAA